MKKLYRTRRPAEVSVQGGLSQLYEDEPNFAGNLFWKTDELVEVANFAVRRGWRIGIHAIGDRAMRTTLDAFEQVVKDNPGLKPGTLAIEHAFLANATQRARAIRLGIGITVQQPLLYSLGQQLLTKWGKERTSQLIPIRAWLEEGAQISAGTDSTGTGTPSYDPITPAPSREPHAQRELSHGRNAPPAHVTSPAARR